MMKLFFLIVLCDTMVSIRVNSQTIASRKEHDGIKQFSKFSSLKIGDYISDFELKNILYHSSSKSKISDFRGKAIIMDFWATWCGTCIDNMPKTSELQKKYKENLAILYVTTQSSEEIQSFFKKHENLKPFILPFIVGDSVFVKLFPHKMIPHVVWLNNQRKIIGITEAVDVSIENVSALIHDQNLELPIKNDIANFDSETSFILNEQGSAKILFNSALTERIQGLPSEAGVKQSSESTRIYAINYSPLALYIFSIKPRLFISPSKRNIKIVLNTQNKKLFSFWDDPKLSTLPSFCYEAIFSKSD